MNAGRLNRLISIVKTTSTARSTDGAPILTITTKASNIWSEKRPLTGRENFINNALFYEADTQFVIRYSTVVTELCQIKDGNDYYDIKNFINPFDRNRELIILGKRVR